MIINYRRKNKLKAIKARLKQGIEKKNNVLLVDFMATLSTETLKELVKDDCREDIYNQVLDDYSKYIKNASR